MRKKPRQQRFAQCQIGSGKRARLGGAIKQRAKSLDFKHRRAKPLIKCDAANRLSVPIQPGQKHPLFQPRDGVVKRCGFLGHALHGQRQADRVMRRLGQHHTHGTRGRDRIDHRVAICPARLAPQECCMIAVAHTLAIEMSNPTETTDRLRFL